MRVADRRPSDRNPRTISTSRFENLKRSLEQDRAFLDARPLLVNSYPGRDARRRSERLGSEDGSTTDMGAITVAEHPRIRLQIAEPTPGLEPGTCGLRNRCSTN